MSKSQITRFILIGLCLYIFGLIFFLSGTDVKDEIKHEEPIAQVAIKVEENEGIKTKYSISYAISPKKGTKIGITKNRYKLHLDLSKTEQRKDDSKNIKRHKSPNSNRLLKRYDEKSKTDPKDLFINNKEYWDNLKNLTFQERDNYVFKRHQSNTSNTPQESDVSFKSKMQLDGHFLKAVKGEEQLSTQHYVTLQDKNLLTTTNVKFLKIIENVFIFSSYFDDRQEKSFIRNVMIANSGKSIYEKLWCHFWDSSLERWKISELEFYETCENHLKVYAAYIGSCEIPENTEYDYIYISNKEETKIHEMTAISVITHDRKAESNTELSVCVPPLFGNINHVRLLEFIEFSILLGFKHITFYTHNVTSEIMNILKHYQKEKLVTTIDWPLTIPDDYIWYHGQSAAVWDCLYRNMYLFKYVAFIDIDEFIFPRYIETLTDFIRQETRNSMDSSDICAYRFQSAYFDPPENSEIPKVLDVSENIEQHVITLNCLDRKAVFSEIRTKMIVDPIKIFELGIHHVSKPMKENFRVENVNPDIAFIHHYRKCESNYGMRCLGKVHDEHALRYKNRLLAKIKWRYYHLLKELFK